MALTKISTDGFKDQAVDLTKLPHGDSNNDGKFLRANNGADPSFETVSGGGSSSSSTLEFDGTTKVEATSTGATVTGKAIATNGFEVNNSLGNIFFRNTAATELLAYLRVQTGTADIITLLANQNNSEIRLAVKNNTGNGTKNKIIITADDVRIGRNMISDNTDVNAIFKFSGGVELYYGVTGQASSKKFETTANGITVQGSVTTEDINMSNLNGSANEVDNTKGSWTIQEGASDLFLINRVNGKKYKFNLTEIS